MAQINLDKVMNTETGTRSNDLHVQISTRNKQFLKREAGRKGIVMGLYLDKLLTLVRQKTEGE